MGSYGTGAGQYSLPYRAVVCDGNIYIAEATTNKVLRFNLNYVYQGWLGLAEDDTKSWHDTTSISPSVHGHGEGALYIPVDVAFDDQGNLYVAEQGNNRIQKFDGTGAMLGWWGLQKLLEPDDMLPALT